MNIYLDVSLHENGCEIYDWSHWMEFSEHLGNYREVSEVKRRMNFRMVQGSQINYHIAGLKNEKQAKAFAIWYHINKSSGNIRTYRLD